MNAQMVKRHFGAQVNLVATVSAQLPWYLLESDDDLICAQSDGHNVYNKSTLSKSEVGRIARWGDKFFVGKNGWVVMTPEIESEIDTIKACYEAAEQNGNVNVAERVLYHVDHPNFNSEQSPTATVKRGMPLPSGQKIQVPINLYWDAPTVVEVIVQGDTIKAIVANVSNYNNTHVRWVACELKAPCLLEQLL